MIRFPIKTQSGMKHRPTEMNGSVSIQDGSSRVVDVRINRDPPFRSYGLSLIVQGIDTQCGRFQLWKNRPHLLPEARTHFKTPTLPVTESWDSLLAIWLFVCHPRIGGKRDLR